MIRKRIEENYWISARIMSLISKFRRWTQVFVILCNPYAFSTKYWHRTHISSWQWSFGQLKNLVYTESIQIQHCEVHYYKPGNQSRNPIWLLRIFRVDRSTQEIKSFCKYMLWPLLSISILKYLSTLSMFTAEVSHPSANLNRTDPQLSRRESFGKLAWKPYNVHQQDEFSRATGFHNVKIKQKLVQTSELCQF